MLAVWFAGPASHDIRWCCLNAVAPVSLAFSARSYEWITTDGGLAAVGSGSAKGADNSLVRGVNGSGADSSSNNAEERRVQLSQRNGSLGFTIRGGAEFGLAMCVS